jgi:hypothetical protein
MGYLDHSTNNIILDAVLTDYGRSKLASGAFKISKFALGDDEVDYTVIKKYGRTVGKEKIEKNTPIFEALTNESIALKYKLIGLSSSGATLRTIYLPTLELSNSNNLSLTNSSPNNSQTLSFQLKFKGSTPTDSDLNANFSSTLRKYTLEVSGRFLQVSAGTGTSSVAISSTLQDSNRTTKYDVVTTSPNFSINITAQSIDSTVLAIYGKLTSSNQRQITTYVTLTNEIGIRYSYPVTYTAATS